MKFNFIITLLLSFLLLQNPVWGNAVRSANVEKALTAAPDEKGMVAVLLHGSDWNEQGEVFKKEIFDSTDLASQLPKDIALCSLDIKSGLTEEDTKRLFAQDCVNVRGVRTYPSIIIADGAGHALTILQPVTDIKTPAELAAILKEWHDKIVKRDTLLAQARKATGTAQTNLLGEALRIQGVGLGCRLNKKGYAFQEALDVMKKSDPSDSTGWIFATEFPQDQIEKKLSELRAEKGLPAAEKEIDQYLLNTHLLSDQRAELQRIRFLLRKEAKEPLDQQLAALKMITDAAPDSVIGRAASKWAYHLQQKTK